MKYKNYIISFFITISLFSAKRNFSQNTIDSITSKSDTIKKNDIYNSIYDITEQRKWTQILRDFVFDYHDHGDDKIIKDKAIENEYEPYKGKIIRKINIITLSPFGTYINTPDSIKQNKLYKSLNSVHVNTRKFVILSTLLLNKGELIDPYKVADAEAYLRTQDFAGDARIYLSETNNSDSVDVNVIIKDRFSMGFDIKNLTFSKYDFELYDYNFLGLGSKLNLRYMNNKKAPDNTIGYGIAYTSPNLLNTFIRTELSYLKDFTSDAFNVAIDRPTQTNLKYLGGISYTLQKKPYAYSILSDTTIKIKNEIISTTLGRVFNMPRNISNTDDKFVVIGRFLFQNNLSDLIPDKNTNYINYPFERKALYIASISFFRQRYYRSSMIYNFGTTEDIAHGYNVTAQIGYEDHLYFNRLYSSLSLSYGKKYKIGYIYSKAAYGTYFRDNKNEQGVLKIKTSYYSPLFNFGKSFFRQFGSIDYTAGIKRFNNTANELIYFSQLTDLNTSKYNIEANGTHRFFATTESNWFSSYSILGFRMVFFSFINLGWLSLHNDNLFKSRNYFSGYGIGIRTRNDQLVFKTIQIKLAWYPQLHQSKFIDFYNFTTSDPQASPNFKPNFPNIIPFE